MVIEKLIDQDNYLVKLKKSLSVFTAVSLQFIFLTWKLTARHLSSSLIEGLCPPNRHFSSFTISSAFRYQWRMRSFSHLSVGTAASLMNVTIGLSYHRGFKFLPGCREPTDTEHATGKREIESNTQAGTRENNCEESAVLHYTTH